jgi:hypothetical protein
MSRVLISARWTVTTVFPVPAPTTEHLRIAYTSDTDKNLLAYEGSVCQAKLQTTSVCPAALGQQY